MGSDIFHRKVVLNLSLPGAVFIVLSYLVVLSMGGKEIPY